LGHIVVEEVAQFVAMIYSRFFDREVVLNSGVWSPFVTVPGGAHSAVSALLLLALLPERVNVRASFPCVCE
jgi:hypothetical protein